MKIRLQPEQINSIAQLYKNSSSRAEKQNILDNLCTMYEYNRKYLIRLLSSDNNNKLTIRGNHEVHPTRRGRPKKYCSKNIIQFLRLMRSALNLACSRRIVAVIHLWLPFTLLPLSENDKKLLLSISFSTVDRLLRPYVRFGEKLGRSTTKPGSLLRKQVPIALNQWDEHKAGFIEADTIAHCGTSVSGQFVYTLQIVDIATGWTECRAVWGKGEQGILKAIQNIEHALPFKLLGFDSDNGSEFLNYHLLKYFCSRSPKTYFTRSRPYHKNDNAHIEEKNWSHVRQYLGYQRIDDIKKIALMNDLYQNEWTMLFNFFVPCMKLISKRREGSRIIKIYDDPRTPLDRVIHCEQGKKKAVKALVTLRNSCNPFELQQNLKQKIMNLFTDNNIPHSPGKL